MAVVATRSAITAWPWQVARHKLNQTLAVSSCRFESSSSSSSATTSSESLFPWRHSPEPLQRVKQNDTFFHQVLIGSMLRRDWHEILLPWIWKESVAEDCAWAFQKGVAALLARIFSVPASDIDKEDLGIVIDTEDLPESEETEQDADKQCSEMLEKRLIELYANVDPSKTNLVLCMKPLSSKLESVFSIIFTREAVQQDPSLAESGRAMRNASRVARDPMQVNRMLRDLDAEKKPISACTIIADVSIHCLEAFQVKDKSSGELVSGSTEPQEVTHLVRFEVTTNLEGSRHLASWKIVDWDDMLAGNVWY